MNKYSTFSGYKNNHRKTVKALIITEPDFSTTSEKNKDIHNSVNILDRNINSRPLSKVGYQRHDYSQAGKLSSDVDLKRPTTSQNLSETDSPLEVQLNRSQDSGFSQEATTDRPNSFSNFAKLLPNEKETKQSVRKQGAVPMIKVLEDKIFDAVSFGAGRPRSMINYKNWEAHLPQQGPELPRRIASDSLVTNRRFSDQSSISLTTDASSHPRATRNSAHEIKKENSAALNGYYSSSLSSADSDVSKDDELKRSPMQSDHHENPATHNININDNRSKSSIQVSSCQNELKEPNRTLSESSNTKSLCSVESLYSLDRETSGNEKLNDFQQMSLTKLPLTEDVKTKPIKKRRRKHYVNDTTNIASDNDETNVCQRDVNTVEPFYLSSASTVFESETHPETNLFEMFGVKLSDFCQQLLSSSSHNVTRADPEEFKKEINYTKFLPSPDRFKIDLNPELDCIAEKKWDSLYNDVDPAMNQFEYVCDVSPMDETRSDGNFQNKCDSRNLSSKALISTSEISNLPELKKEKHSKPKLPDTNWEKHKQPEFSIKIDRRPIWNMDPVPPPVLTDELIMKESDVPLYCKFTRPVYSKKQTSDTKRPRETDLSLDVVDGKLNKSHLPLAEKSANKLIRSEKVSKVRNDDYGERKTANNNDLELSASTSLKEINDAQKHENTNELQVSTGKPFVAVNRVARKRKVAGRRRSTSQRRKEYLIETGLEIFKTIEDELKISRRLKGANPSSSIGKRIENIFSDHQEKRIRFGLDDDVHPEILSLITSRFDSDNYFENSLYRRCRRSSLQAPSVAELIERVYNERINLEAKERYLRLLSLPGYTCHRSSMSGHDNSCGETIALFQEVLKQLTIKGQSQDLNNSDTKSPDLSISPKLENNEIHLNNANEKVKSEFIKEYNHNAISTDLAEKKSSKDAGNDNIVADTENVVLKRPEDRTSQNHCTTKTPVTEETLETVCNISDLDVFKKTTDPLARCQSLKTDEHASKLVMNYEDLAVSISKNFSTPVKHLDNDTSKASNLNLLDSKTISDNPLTVISNERILVVTECEIPLITFTAVNQTESISKSQISPVMCSLKLSADSSNILEISSSQTFSDSDVLSSSSHISAQNSEENLSSCGVQSTEILEEKYAETDDTIDSVFETNPNGKKSYYELNINKKRGSSPKRTITILSSGSASDAGDDCSGEAKNAKELSKNHNVFEETDDSLNSCQGAGVLDLETTKSSRCKAEVFIETPLEINNNNNNNNNNNQTTNNSDQKLISERFRRGGFAVTDAGEGEKANIKCSVSKHVTFSENISELNLENLSSKGQSDINNGTIAGASFNSVAHIDDVLTVPSKTQLRKRYPISGDEFIYQEDRSKTRSNNCEMPADESKTPVFEASKEVKKQETSDLDLYSKSTDQNPKSTVGMDRLSSPTFFEGDTGSHAQSKLGNLLGENILVPPPPPRVIHRLDAVKVTDYSTAQDILKKAFRDRKFGRNTWALDDQDAGLLRFPASSFSIRKKQRKSRGKESEPSEELKKVSKDAEIQTEESVDSNKLKISNKEKPGTFSHMTHIGLAILAIALAYAVYFFYRLSSHNTSMPTG